MEETESGAPDPPIERRKYKERRADHLPTTWPILVFELARRYGLWAVVAIGLLYFLVGNVQGTQQTLLQELRDHSRESAWVQRQECISLAVLAGSRPELCNPPSIYR